MNTNTKLKPQAVAIDPQEDAIRNLYLESLHLVEPRAEVQRVSLFSASHVEYPICGRWTPISVLS